MAKRPMGIYVAQYGTPWNPTLEADYNRIYDLIRWNPDINWLVAINPASGYGFNKKLVDYTYAFQQAGAKVLGYFSVNYGTQNYRPTSAWGPVMWPNTDLATMKQQVDLYLRDYWLDGFMLDDHPSVVSGARDTYGQLSWDTQHTTLQTITDLVTYIRTRMKTLKNKTAFIKANVGTRPAPEYYWLYYYDNINIWEGNNRYPTYKEIMDYTYGGYYCFDSTVTVHHTWWQENLLNPLAYRIKYICLHEKEFTNASVMLPNMIAWCRKYL